MFNKFTTLCLPSSVTSLSIDAKSPSLTRCYTIFQQLLLSLLTRSLHHVPTNIFAATNTTVQLLPLSRRPINSLIEYLFMSPTTLFLSNRQTSSTRSPSLAALRLFHDPYLQLSHDARREAQVPKGRYAIVRVEQRRRRVQRCRKRPRRRSLP